MTNENNNINELVAEGDDPTAELENLIFARSASEEEADAQTYNSQEDDDSQYLAASSDVSELAYELISHKKLNGRLQFDLDQLHAKWLGLQAEVSARESQTALVNDELSASQDLIAHKDKLIKKRDRTIKGLKTEIHQLGENFKQLETHFDKLLLTANGSTANRDTDEEPSAPSNGDQTTDEVLVRLNRTEEYADAIRQQSLDLIEQNSRQQREIDSLSNQLTVAKEQSAKISKKFSSANTQIEELQSALNVIQDQHDDQEHARQGDLDNAHSELAQVIESNMQLASTLADTQSFKDQLERMLGDTEKQSAERIEQLENEVRSLTNEVDGLDQKLATKGAAISMLLAEIAKKAERIDPVGEIEEVIQDIDERLTEHKPKSAQVEPTQSAERISRVLVGTVDNRTLRFPLFKKSLTIGRTRDNDIQINAVFVSRRHAVIQTDKDVTRIIDWGSKNGIRVNSATVSEHFLSHGDTILIGNARFRYEERKKRDS